MTSSAPAERVLYVDSTGRVLEARRLSKADADGRCELLVSYNAAVTLTVQRARYSADREPGTWHRPPLPS